MHVPERQAVGTSTIAIIVVVVIIVAGVGIYFATTGSGTSTTSTTTTTSTAPATTTTTTGPPAPRQFKVALVGASVSSNYFAEFFQQSAHTAAQALSNSNVQVTVSQAYSVSASQVVSVCQTYASEGYNLIELYVDYAGSYTQIAKQVPGVEFIDEFNTPNGYNATSYNYANPDANMYTYNATNMVGWDTNIYGAYYVAGVASALATKTSAVGFEGAFNIGAIAAWYNDFAMGVHSVNPNMKVYYTFTNDWTDTTKGAAAADSLISEGAGVVATAGDTQSIGAAKEAVAKGTYGIGYPANLNNLSASYMLGSTYFNATRLWMDILTDALSNNLAGHYYSVDFSHGGNQFVVNPALVTSGVITSSMTTKINQAEQALNSYTVVLPINPTFPPEPS